MALMKSLNVLCDGFNHNILPDCFSVSTFKLSWLLDIDRTIIMGRKCDRILCIVIISLLHYLIVYVKSFLEILWWICEKGGRGGTERNKER